VEVVVVMVVVVVVMGDPKVIVDAVSTLSRGSKGKH
jgi:Sec-independent protein translocase protein TatA